MDPQYPQAFNSATVRQASNAGERLGRSTIPLATAAVAATGIELPSTDGNTSALASGGPVSIETPTARTDPSSSRVACAKPAQSSFERGISAAVPHEQVTNSVAKRLALTVSAALLHDSQREIIPISAFVTSLQGVNTGSDNLAIGQVTEDAGNRCRRCVIDNDKDRAGRKGLFTPID